MGVEEKKFLLSFALSLSLTLLSLLLHYYQLYTLLPHCIIFLESVYMRALVSVCKALHEWLKMKWND